MDKLKVGSVFKVHGTKFVMLSINFIEWWNTGGMGEYHYEYAKLEDMVRYGDYKNLKQIPVYTFKSTDRDLNKRGITILEDEPPFEITEEVVTLHSARRKKPKTITIYE